MKKNGFTLAEVLITLAIIGAVATLTLPTLMNNAKEQQYIAGLKKGINTLSEAGQTNEAISSFNYSTITENSKDRDSSKQSLYSILAHRTLLDSDRTRGLSDDTILSTLNANTSENYAVFFRDGTALIFGTKHTSNPQVVYDTNGLKAPNTISNCKGESNKKWIEVKETDYDSGSANSCSGSDRVIRDQFIIRLRDSAAVPDSAAARWALNH